jgi:hypothetical protein
MMDEANGSSGFVTDNVVCPLVDNFMCPSWLQLALLPEPVGIEADCMEVLEVLACGECGPIALIGECCSFGVAPTMQNSIPLLACYDILVDVTGAYVELVSLIHYFARISQCTDKFVHDAMLQGANLLREQYGWSMPHIIFVTTLKRETFSGDSEERQGPLCFPILPLSYTFISCAHIELAWNLMGAGVDGSLSFERLAPTVDVCPDFYVDHTGAFFEVLSFLSFLAANPVLTGHYGVSADTIGRYLADALYVEAEIQANNFFCLTFHNLILPLYGFEYGSLFVPVLSAQHVLDLNDSHYFGAVTQIASILALLKDVPVGGFAVCVNRDRSPALEPRFFQDNDDQIAWIHNCIC